ncbi:MAG: hypothetical protein RLZZ196_3232 [Bacteroidota bacterium]|jgi:hypothetical protein
MGKLKEHYLNNLTPEEMEERYGVSAFEYVELMEKYKKLFDDNGDPIPNEVAEQIAIEREQLENEYYEQSKIDEINDSLARTFTEDEIIEAVRKWKNEDWFIDRVRAELNKIWNRKNGYE